MMSIPNICFENINDRNFNHSWNRTTYCALLPNSMDKLHFWIYPLSRMSRTSSRSNQHGRRSGLARD